MPSASAVGHGRAVGHAVLTALCALTCLAIGYYTFVILVGLPFLAAAAVLAVVGLPHALAVAIRSVRRGERDSSRLAALPALLAAGTHVYVLWVLARFARDFFQASAESLLRTTSDRPQEVRAGSLAPDSALAPLGRWRLQWQRRLVWVVCEPRQSKAAADLLYASDGAVPRS